MLTPEQFTQIGKEASKIYSDLELKIIEEIAERIANVGYANTVVQNDVKIAQEMGLLYQDIVQLVAEYNNTSYDKIQAIFNDAGIKTLKFDDRIYKAVGLNPIPIKQSQSMLQLLLATAEKTNNNLNNLIMTTADTSQTAFYNSMNKAYMEVSTGEKSYSSSILDTIKELSKKSATVKYPSGYETSIENAVRMNIVTGVNQTCGKLQMMRANQLGWDLMELTAHSGARPEHAEWQGKIVSLSGNKKYLTLEDIGYGTATGFKGVNCNHDWHPYYEGMSRIYSDEELEKMKNETVTYNGEQIKRYDAQQMQRKIERQIRQDKKDLAGLQGTIKGAKDDKLMEEAKANLTNKELEYKAHTDKLNDFLKQTGYGKDNTRLFVSKQVTNGNKGDIMTQNINKEDKKLRYVDATDQYKEKKKYQVRKQKYFIDNEGVRYNVDGKYVILKPTQREIEVAGILGEMVGGRVNIVPRINEPEGIKTPDYIINGKKFDLKEIKGNSKNSLYNALGKQRKQADNFVFDISNTEINEKEAIIQIKSIYNSNHRKWVRDLILIRNNKILKIYKRG